VSEHRPAHFGGLRLGAAGALPLLIASVVMLVPKKIPRKRRFVVVSGALSYGFTCFFALLLLPFFLAGAQLSDQPTVDGHAVWASALDFLGKYLLMALFMVWVFFAVTVPIYLRRKWVPVGKKSTVLRRGAVRYSAVRVGVKRRSEQIP
jgi:hypothetical protein